MTQRPRPTEPPLTGYTRDTRAPRRFRPHWPSIISAASVLGISVTAVLIVLNDSPARGAADRAAVVVTPTASPGVPVPSRKGPEYSPPVPVKVPGDGTWLVGKQVKPGIYQSVAGPLCYWERLAGLSGKYVDLIDNGGFRKGPTLVEVLASDFAFGSQGCGEWVKVS